MAEAEFEAVKRLISDIGKQLASQKTCPKKDVLVKLLRQAASAFPLLDQMTSLESTIKPLSDSLIKLGLLQHKDKDVQLLVALCCCEIIRILAPNPNFSDAVFMGIFKLFISMFLELSDTTSPYFSRRVKVLETVAKLKFCVLMLDTGCEDLVLEMFNTFFTVVREHHPQSLINAMLSIMALILKEKVSQQLLDVILQNLLREGKGASPASSLLAVSVIQSCAEELEPFICGFLISCILDRDAVGTEIKEFYHEIIFEIVQFAPQMLIAVIPNLTQELLTDQVDVRIKAVNLMGRLFALPGRHIYKEYHHLFVEFLKRFSDKSPEVRLSALSCAKAFCMINPSGTESLEILTAVEGRLLDFDDRVRIQAVTVVCDLVISNLRLFPPGLVSRVADRLRDKKASVRKKAMQKLLEVYHDYCTKCSGGIMALTDHFEHIPCRILMLCYDKDCKEFRPQNIELVLAEDLFPTSVSIEERTQHWIFIYSLFSPSHIKALDVILNQKRRLQAEMQVYLGFRRKEEENDSDDVQKRLKTSFMKMSASFPDPAKAEECFYKLNLLKDNSIFSALLKLLDEVAITKAQTTRDHLLRKIGDKHPHFGFLQLLSTKCLFNIFSYEHVRCILDHLSGDRFGDKNLEASSVKLLVAITRTFPSLLKGCEKQFQFLLLEEDITFNEELIQMLATAGPHLSIKLSDIYPFLERVCLEGTRAQSKLATAAIAAMAGTSEQLMYSKLCKTLVDSLHSGKNIPTVLQSLGCIAQHSVSTYENHVGEITHYIVEKLFRVTDVEISDDIGLSNDYSGCSTSCKLKIFGLKALVKSFLPHQRTPVRQKINKLLDVLLQMLQDGEASNDTVSCEADKAHVRLAAAKSVLRLSRRWDLHISPQIFHLTIMVAMDSSFIGRLFVNKTHKLLKKHGIPIKYACAFALAASDSLKDLHDDSLKYMAEFIGEYSREVRIRRTSAMQGGVIVHPTYMVVFLIHVLAHDSGFPPESCRDEEIYVKFCSPFVFTLQALLDASVVDGDMDLISDAISYLRSIFHAIKRAEDAVDAHATTKLHILADLGLSIINALDHSGISSLQASGTILLPSSLYKISPAGKMEEANLLCLHRCGFNENIVKRMVHSSISHLSQSACTSNKRRQKCQGDCSEPNVIKKKHLLRNGTRGGSGSSYAHQKKMDETLKEEMNRRGRPKGSPYFCLSESVGLHNEFSIDDEHDREVSGNSEPVTRKEQHLSSCDSATTRLSLAQKEVLLNPDSSNENKMVTKCNSTAEPSKCIRVNHSDPCCSKAAGKKGEVLIGQRIKLWSPIDKCYYSGKVDEFYPQNDAYKIAYDSGEVEVLSLETESWETISDDFRQEKDTGDQNLHCCNPGEQSFFSGQTEIVDAFKDDLSQEANLPMKGREKEKKRHRISADKSTSEVIDTNKDTIARRTRSRKA